MREQGVKLIEQMLEARGTIKRQEIIDELGVHPVTATSWLCHMHKDLRIISRSKRRADGTIDWMLGEDKTLPAAEVEESRSVVPARQVGMWRDALVAAFFGPAQGVAA